MWTSKAWYQNNWKDFFAPHIAEFLIQGKFNKATSSFHKAYINWYLINHEERRQKLCFASRSFLSHNPNTTDSPTLAQHLLLHKAKCTASCCTVPQKRSPKSFLTPGLLECDLLILAQPGEKEHLCTGLLHTFQLIFHPALYIQISKIPQPLEHLIIAHAIIYLVH